MNCLNLNINRLTSLFLEKLLPRKARLEMIKKKNNYVENSVSASKVKIPQNKKIKSKQGYLLHLWCNANSVLY